LIHVSRFQQEAYRSISSDKFQRAPDLLHLSNSFAHCARKKRSYGACGDETRELDHLSHHLITSLKCIRVYCQSIREIRSASTHGRPFLGTAPTTCQTVLQTILKQSRNRLRALTDKEEAHARTAVNDSDGSQSPDLRVTKPLANCGHCNTASFRYDCFFYISVSVKLPEPVQPDCAPVKVRAPNLAKRLPSRTAPPGLPVPGVDGRTHRCALGLDKMLRDLPRFKSTPTSLKRHLRALEGIPETIT